MGFPPALKQQDSLAVSVQQITRPKASACLPWYVLTAEPLQKWNFQDFICGRVGIMDVP